jgi:hypothetical protein
MALYKVAPALSLRSLADALQRFHRHVIIR